MKTRISRGAAVLLIGAPFALCAQTPSPSSPTDDEISEAFRCGGRGFVVKTRMADDLEAAIDQVLAGRRFAPTLTSLFGPETPWRLSIAASSASP